MLSRFFVSAKQQQQQQPSSNGLGDVDALDQSARDPRQAPPVGTTPTTMGKSNDDDDDDDESSAANMSFLDNDDDGTVDTTNSGMVLDMVKNSFFAKFGR
jgi:hypothetical protein